MGDGLLGRPWGLPPLEQEVSRALANRWARGIGTGPIARQAGVVGFGFVAFLVGATLIASPLILDHLLDDEVVLLVSFLLAIVGYAAVHLTRGVLAGMGRFRGYARYYTAENVIRLAACALLAAAGVMAARGLRPHRRPGPVPRLGLRPVGREGAHD